jgi:hypothetical protein
MEISMPIALPARPNLPLLPRTLVALLAALVLGSAGCSGVVDSEGEGLPAEEALTGSFPVGTPLETTAYLNLRERPSPSARILEVIPSGATVLSAAAQPVAGWYGVTWEGQTGWSSGQYLRRQTQVPTGQSGGFTRQQVYDLIAPRMRPGEAGAARDLLNPGLTTQKLVDALGWIATHNPPDWEVSALNTNHRYNPATHSSGYAADLYARSPADDLRMIRLLDQNPYIVELGLSGDYLPLLGQIRNKLKFSESAPTHIHFGVRQAYGY